MNSIPNELKLQILHHHRDLLPDLPFAARPVQAMARDDGYNTLLLRMSLYHREWTALAQSELFYRIILANERKTELLLKLLREKEVFADYAKSAKSIRVGRRYGHYDGTGLRNVLDEIADYCPDIVELSCANSYDVRLEYLQALTKLDKLNLCGGSLLGPSSSTAPSNSPLPITHLCIYHVRIDSLALDPTSLLSLRSLHLNGHGTLLQPYLPLLPQLTSLTLARDLDSQDLNTSLAASTALTSLSLPLSAITYLDTANLLMMKQRITTLELTWSEFVKMAEELINIIEGSEVMKKIILDGLFVTGGSERDLHVTELVGRVKPGCKKKGIELWRKNLRTNEQWKSRFGFVRYP